jgi:hypothetical protein
MKKTVMLITVLALVAGAVFAQADLPTKAEAARLIEGFFHCIGNGDMENLPKYFSKQEEVEEGIDYFAAISASLNETEKKECIAFKADITRMMPILGNITNTYFVRCFLAKNSLSSYMDLVKENGVWKLQ